MRRSRDRNFFLSSQDLDHGLAAHNRSFATKRKNLLEPKVLQYYVRRSTYCKELHDHYLNGKVSDRQRLNKRLNSSDNIGQCPIYYNRQGNFNCAIMLTVCDISGYSLVPNHHSHSWLERKRPESELDCIADH